MTWTVAELEEHIAEVTELTNKAIAEANVQTPNPSSYNDRMTAMNAHRSLVKTAEIFDSLNGGNPQAPEWEPYRAQLHGLATSLMEEVFKFEEV